jgi:hypothetical protein
VLKDIKVSRELKVHKVYKVNPSRVFRVRLLPKDIKVLKVLPTKVFRAVKVFKVSAAELDLMVLRVLRVLPDLLQVITKNYFITITVVLVVLLDSLGMERIFPIQYYRIDTLEVIVLSVIITMQFTKNLEGGHLHSQT